MGGKAPREAKYTAIAADLAARIRSGDYRPGQALPSQRELSAAYGVTLMTLRQALRVLEQDGLLTQQPGRGTFAAEPLAAYQLDSLRSLADDLLDQGHQVSTEVVRVALRRLPNWAGDQFGDSLGEPALRLERVRLLNGLPAVHQVSWVREPAASLIRSADFTVTSLYGALAEHGIVVHRASERLRPALLDAPAAGLLHEPEGTPVFVSDRITYGLNGSAILIDRATILGNVMEIRTERAAGGLSLRWTRNG